MTPRHPASPRTRTVRHARGIRHHRVLQGTALLGLSLLSFVVTGAATAYVRLQNNIASADVEELLGDDRPPAAVPDPDDPYQGVPLNILVLGSDSRAGSEDLVADGEEGQRSDTTIIMHVSADRQRVEMVSIPRDSLVDIPRCLRADGSTSTPREQGMFNAAFSIGGESGLISDAAACTQRTVEQTTGVRIDHFIVVNMSGFVSMIDALDEEGIPICIEQEIISPKANGLHLLPGQQRLDGVTALNYARARTGTGLGDGSDTNRIGRQQELLAATAREVLSKNLLTDADQLFRFLVAATRSLTISSGLSSLTDLTGLALSLNEVPGDRITFMTIPWVPAPSDPDRVVWTDAADQVWANLIADVPVTTVPAPEEPDPVDPEVTPTEPAPDPTATDAPVDPTPAATPTPGIDAFTADDVTTTGSVCGTP